MKFLSLETSTKYSVLAISDEKGLIFGARRLFENGRADGIGVLIQEGLKKTRIKIEKIGCFGVGAGPGSFTGLRIALSTIKGFAYALNMPVVSFPSLDAIAYNAKDRVGAHLCVMVDARRSNVYCRFYEKHWKTIKHKTCDELMPIGDLLSRCNASTVFCGDGAGLYKQEIENRFRAARILAENLWFPSAESISQLTLEAFGSGEAKSCFEVSATYLYEQDCQVSPALKR
ncbi:MAG: tRNA (adenosine(37)-N6)-threonylcarbamoyltransferase complex dimerization subunit type 1 TsaB [Candidatus Omnitrophica bacterium]|nr:tRNA (adenosine(37)-N6)-threonylcarbamoyltransferase complex dimerization subunit type 1 TsaB [Candidatus Omnitrophota bacterium]